jgi:inosine/xanthosine triphosphatase
MLTVVVASTNPVKIQAVKNGFERIFASIRFTFTPVEVSSNVSSQPSTDDETMYGATQRARNARLVVPLADYWVGVEGGIEDRGQEMAAFAWIVILASDDKRRIRIGKARTGTFFLPHPVAELVRAGKELGEADDIVFNREGSKRENGAIGLLTGDVVDRRMLYEQAVILALLPFRNPDLYQLLSD